MELKDMNTREECEEAHTLECPRTKEKRLLQHTQ